MDIEFDGNKLTKCCNDSKERARKFGPERAKRLGRRLDQLRFADNLADFKTVHPRCHRLKEDRAGQWSADLDGPYRLIFVIADDPVPLADDGSIDLNKVTKVRVIDVEDTHGD